MTSSRFDLSPTLKTLNLSILQFIKQSGFQNHTSHKLEICTSKGKKATTRSSSIGY